MNPIAAAIISRLTYQPAWHSNITIDPVALERNCPLDNGRRRPNPIQEHTCSTLGLIDTLPPELYSEIFSYLDLQTLTEFRSVNRRAGLVVDSIPQYREVVTHFLNPLRAVISTGLGPYLTLRDLHNALCSQTCVHCGDFGACVYLFTCSRVCFPCLAEQERCLPMTRMSAKEVYGLENRTIPTLPTLRSLPDSYSYADKSCRKRVNLVDREAARQAGISTHGSSAAMEQYVSRKRAQMVAAYEDKIHNNQKPRKPTCPPYTSHNDGRASDPYRFMGAIRAPSLNRKSKAVDLGVACNACRSDYWPLQSGPLDYRRMYTDDGYLDHLGECEMSQAAWGTFVSADKSTALTKDGSLLRTLYG